MNSFSNESSNQAMWQTPDPILKFLKDGSDPIFEEPGSPMFAPYWWSDRIHPYYPLLNDESIWGFDNQVQYAYISTSVFQAHEAVQCVEETPI